MSFYFLETFQFQRLLPPLGFLSWFAWLGLAGLVTWLVWRLRGLNHKLGRNQWIWLASLVGLIPISILLFSVRLPSEGLLPIPALGPPAVGPLLPILAAIPWVLAIPLLGPIPAIGLAFFSGLFLAFWDTRSPFTPLEIALFAALFATALTQPYRTRLFRWLRQPLVAGLVLAAVYPLVYLLTAFFWAAGDPLSSLDFALARLLEVTFAVGVPLLIAGGLLQGLRARLPLFAKVGASSQPAPSERSLEARLLFTLAPIVLLAFFALGALAWWSANRSAEELLGDRAQASAELAADSVPFLLETGQNLILQLAGDTRLADASAQNALVLLQNHLRAIPYFEQLVLLDTGGNTLVAYPVADFADLQPGPAEFEAVSLAIQGMAFQALTVAPLDPESSAAQLSFVAAVRNDNGQVRAVLLGRTNLASNPLGQPVLQSLHSINALGGEGYLIDGEGRIVLAPSAAAILQPYNGRLSEIALSYEDSGPDGSRRFVNYVPVTGSSWAVVTHLPGRLSQALALELALPILLVLLVLAVVAYWLLRASLRAVTSPLQELISESRRIAAGDLQAPLTVKSADEVGRLATAFESMRQALQARVGETQRLLSVSQGVSTNLDAGAHIDPILEAALAGGAVSARLVFSADANGKNLVGFGRGAASAQHQGLDEQVLSLSRTQRRVLLTNPARARLKAAKGAALPQSLAAFALEDGGETLGALWVAFDTPQTFAPDAVHYLETLAGQAAKAASNARLYSTANVGRQRLEAVLQSDPDPLLVSDEHQRVVFANRAAKEALTINDDAAVGVNINQIIPDAKLAAWLRSGEASSEMELEIGGVPYRAEAFILQDNARPLGMVLQLRNLSQSKQIESSRNELLSTLSHDLHDPLELTKGYVNMLGMVGDLNEQQAAYLQKIEHSVENISHLAANLLDIERVSGVKGLQVQSFPVADLVKDVCDELVARARQKKIDFATQKVLGQVQPLQADRTLLQRALYNLVDNAIKFSPRDGVVEVKTKFARDQVTLSVTDHGVGIAPLDLPSVFEAGQGKARKASGLVIVKSIVERHGGRAWAESELGTGSTFHIELLLTPPTKPLP